MNQFRVFSRALAAFKAHRHAVHRLHLSQHIGSTDQFFPSAANTRCQLSFYTRFSTASVDEAAKTTASMQERNQMPKGNSKESRAETAPMSNQAEAEVKSDDDSGLESEAEEPTKDAEKGLPGALKEKEAMLKNMDRLIAEAKQKVLSNLAEVENIRGRTRRDSEGIKKYAVENFAKSLLDMADNLGHTSSSVPESFRNETLANDTSNHAKLLKSLFEGVDMTEKQLLKIFHKFGLQKYEPIGEQYDSKKHFAITEVDDPTKEPRTIVSIVRPGYMLHDKLLRHAEVGVVKKPPEKPKVEPNVALDAPPPAPGAAA